MKSAHLTKDAFFWGRLRGHQRLSQLCTGSLYHHLDPSRRHTMPFLLTYSCKDWQWGSESWFHHLSKPSTPGGSSRTILFRFLEVYLHTSQVENKTRSQEQQESGVWLSVPFSYVFLSHRVPFAEKQLDRVVSGARPYLEACFCGAKGIDTSFFLPQRKQKLIILTEEVQKFLGGD